MNIYKDSWPPVRIHDKCDFSKEAGMALQWRLEAMH